MALKGLIASLGAVAGGAVRGLDDAQRQQQEEDDRKWREEQRRQQAELTRGLADAMKPAQVDAGYRVTDEAGSDAFTKDADAAAALADMSAAKGRNMSLSSAAYRGTVPMADRPAPPPAVGLASYLRPAAGAPTPAPRQDVTLGSFLNRKDAQKAVDQYNAPEAQADRVSLAYARSGQPDKGLAYTENAQQIAKRRSTAQQEGYFEALSALRAGDADGAVSAFNRSGKWKVQGGIQLTPAEREIPGFGKVRTYDAAFTAVDSDGNTRPMKINSHDASMAVMPLDKQLELSRKGIDSEAKNQIALERLENQAKLMEAQGRLAEARAVRAEAQAISAGAGGGGKAPAGYRWTKTGDLEAIAGGPADDRAKRFATSDERSRASTALGDVSSRLSAARKELAALPPTTSGMFGEQRANLAAEIKRLEGEHKLYSGVVAGSLGGTTEAEAPARPSPTPAAKKTPTPQPAVKPTGKVVSTDYSSLWK